MKFKILESVFDSFKFNGDSYFVYLNPTSQELNSKEDTKNNRGIIDPEGNLYIEAKWKNEKKEGQTLNRVAKKQKEGNN